MSMTGSSGPDHKYLGFGLTIGALTGLQHLCGLPGRAGRHRHQRPDHIPQPVPAAFTGCGAAAPSAQR